MILDDLFEQKPLPAHIKASDLPPGMRPRLTMKDIEAQRPKSAYRYQVGDKQFMDLRAAQEFAAGTGEKVIPLAEQADDPDVQRGMANLLAIEKSLTNNQKVMIQNELNRPEYQIELPKDKQWLINHAKEWIDAGRANDLYKYMGTNAGFDFLLSAWQKEDAIRAKSRQTTQAEPEELDLFSPGQGGGPKSARLQRESQQVQKKRLDLEEAPEGARGRTERMLAQMRARQPQAASDLEALAYELQDAEARDKEEITKLEREVDNLETDVKQELQKRISSLTKRRGGIKQAAAQDVKIDTALDQLARINAEQQREINNLERAVASIGQPQISALPALSGATDRSAQPKVQVPYTAKTKTVTSPEVDRFQQAVVEPLMTPATVSPAADQAPIEPDTDQEIKPSATVTDIRSRFKVPDAVAPRTGTMGEGVKDIKSAASTFARALRGKAGPSPFDVEPVKIEVPQSGTKSLPSKTVIQPAEKNYSKRTPAQQAAMQSALAPAVNAAPAGWQYGDPITIGKQVIKPRDPNYEKIARTMSTITEKSKPVPTNASLWSRAKSAARSKFDVYPSAYANAWAAKWYKSKGGGWRMGKSKE